MIMSLLAIGLPTLTVLVGILLNRGDANRLDARISQMEARLDSRISALESRLDARIGGLEGRFHADMMLVIGKLTELDVRVSKLEVNQ